MTRLAVVVAVAGVAVVPAGSAAAGSDEQQIEALAGEAVAVLREEQLLVERTRSQEAVVTAESADATRLAAVDARGNEIMVELILLGADLTEATRVTLERLPEADPGRTRPIPPPAVVYEAAIDDLQRMVATPSAATPDDAHGRSMSLLIVAAVAVMALGLAALSNSLRRKGDALELDSTDGLTGVNTRRRLDQDLEQHRHDSHAHTAVMMIDVDDLALIGASFGRHVADDVLKRLGTLLSAAVREGDVVYRYDGEQFCVLLPGATRSEATAVVERVVAAARMIVLPDSSRVTVSVGLAEGAPSDLVDTLESADRAMNAAKAGGR